MTALDDQVDQLGDRPQRWGLDASKPIKIPVERYISPEWMAIENDQGVAEGVADRLLGRPRGRAR